MSPVKPGASPYEIVYVNETARYTEVEKHVKVHQIPWETLCM